MNTSNKILIGFLLFIFLGPVFLFMSFRKKINNKEFTIAKNEWGNRNVVAQALPAHRYIKISGTSASENLECALRPAKEAKLVYYKKLNGDSLFIQTVGDTLVINFVNTSKEEARKEQEYFSSLSLELFLPAIGGISAEKVTLYADSLAGKEAVFFDLQDAELHLGNPDHFDGDTPGYWDGPNKNTTTISATLDSALIKGNNSKLVLGPSLAARHIAADLSGKSLLFINPLSQVNNLTGTVSDSTSVKGDWKYFKHFNK